MSAHTYFAETVLTNTDMISVTNILFEIVISVTLISILPDFRIKRIFILKIEYSAINSYEKQLI